MARVTLVGGSSFVGVAVAAALLDAGHRVEVGDLVGPQLPARSGLTYRRCDIREAESLRSLFADCDAVFHLAALLERGCQRSPRDGWATNVLGTINVLAELVGQPDPPDLYFFSSAAAYDSPAQSLPIAEHHPTRARSLYTAAKLAAEQAIRTASYAVQLRAAIFRPFTIYGPGPASGDRGHFVARCLERAAAGLPLIVHGDGSQTIDLVHVSDVARLCCRAVERSAASTDVPVLNVGSGTETSVRECVGWIAGGFPGTTIEYVPGLATSARLCADLTRTTAVLGYRPSIAPRAGIEALIETCRLQPARQS